MLKQSKYLDLVNSRKHCNACQELVNPSVIDVGIYDSDQIGPWSRWQGNLDAKVLVIGQDWGTVDYLKKWNGLDDQNNPTNKRLRVLLEDIGIAIPPPGDIGQDGVIFLSNAILCLKQTPFLQGPVKDEWFANCGSRYLKPLIDLIWPRVVIALGMKAFQAVIKAYHIDYHWPATYREVVEREGRKGGIKLIDNTLLFPVYHCGNRITTKTRKLDQQKSDWEAIVNTSKQSFQ